MAESRASAGAVVALVALAAFTVFITWQAKTLEIGMEADKTAYSLTGKPAPDFQLQATDGRTVSLKDFRNKKKVVVSFWASWCGPCRREMPVLRDFYQKHHKADSDFEFLAISVDQQRSDAETAATQDKLPFPVLLDLQQKVSEAYAVRAIPTLLVIDKSGKVTYGAIGSNPMLEYTLPDLLGLAKEGAHAGSH